MKIKNALVAVAVLAVATSAAMAQPPQGGPPGGGGHPILDALDPDHNHELSAEEINNATKALKALDKNGDGKLDEEDLGRMGPPGGGPPGGHGGGPPGNQGGRGGPGGGSTADQGKMVSDFASRLLAFDKNENGKIEKDELPPRMQGVLDRLDKNKDDVLDESELGEMKSAAKEASSSSGGRKRGGGAEGRRGGREGAEGRRGGRGGARGGQGGGTDRMIEHAFEFDKDGDGKLSREELTEFAKSMPQPGGGGPGAGGHRGGGPPDGGRGGPPGGGRGGR